MNVEARILIQAIWVWNPHHEQPDKEETEFLSLSHVK